jgi:subtilase family serine protease
VTRRWRLLLAAAAVAVAGCGPRPHVMAVPAGNPLAGLACGPGGAEPPLGATQLQRAYQAPGMFARGIDGTGTTIAEIVPYADPWLAADLAVYSRRYHLPVPRLQVIAWQDPPGSSRAPGPAQAGWAQEGTLDLELAHAMAPGARLLSLQIPAAGPDSSQYTAGLSWLVTRQQVTVVNFSAGIPERWAYSTTSGYAALLAARTGLQAAARAQVTVVASSGDYGATEPAPDGTLYPFPVVAWPASDPLATAVGGTRLHTAPSGQRTSPDTVFAGQGGSAGGAGRSAVFARPAWQDSVRAVVGSRRGVADVSMDASPCSPALAYTSTNTLPGQHPGWVTVMGTSVAAPLFAGIVADAAQIAGRRLGVLGPALYRLHGTADGVMDVTAGTTTTPQTSGYPARPGYDLPTGIGTVGNAGQFAAALARQAQLTSDDR